MDAAEILKELQRTTYLRGGRRTRKLKKSKTSKGGRRGKRHSKRH